VYKWKNDEWQGRDDGEGWNGKSGRNWGYEQAQPWGDRCLLTWRSADACCSVFQPLIGITLCYEAWALEDFLSPGFEWRIWVVSGGEYGGFRFDRVLRGSADWERVGVVGK
jgi:hypothetical protein